MDVGFQILGGAKFAARLDGIPTKLNNAVYQGFRHVGSMLTDDAVEEMDAPKTGRTYSYNGRKYTASSPWEFPANRSGYMRSSFNYKANAQQMEWGPGVGKVARKPYFKYLENGTRGAGGWRMEPRAYIATMRKTKVQKIRLLMINRIATAFL